MRAARRNELPVAAGGGDTPAARARQVRRAWAFIGVAFTVFLFGCGALGGAGYWYRGHATTERLVRVEVVQGERAFIRPAFQRNWSAIQVASREGRADAEPRAPGVAGAVVLREGDALRTEEGTRVFLTLWDGSSVEVFERTQVEITEMRTTQYINRASAFSLRQSRGLVRVAVAPGDYSRSRFQITTDPDPRTGRDRVTVLMKEGGERTNGGSFLVEVTPGIDGESIATVRASVRRGVGAVRVAARDGELRLGANEQTIVPAGGVPGPRTPARRDLVANGAFVPQGEPGRNYFAPWQDTSTPGPRGGPFGSLTRVTDTVDGREVGVLEIARDPNSADSANTGLRQPLNWTVADLPTLELTADLKVLEQSLPGGGIAGSEFPILVRIQYHDAIGKVNSRTWGFYITPDPAGTKPEVGQLVPEGEWFPFRIDLRDLAPQPFRLDAIEVYASGHGYRARITNVAIISTE